jgi:organic radical activating enzyme
MNVPQWAINHEHPGAIHKGVVLVMTGGEPLIQENISQFMKEQLPRFKAVQVESNGIPETEVPEGVVLVCSPKCAEKNGVATQYFKPSKTILERADCLKFVMSADKLSPYNTIPQWAFDWKERTGKEIYCSPMNVYNTFPQKIKILRAEKGQITMAERSTVDEIISWWEKDLLDMSKNQANHEYVGQYCVDNGLRAQMQTHLFMSLA